MTPVPPPPPGFTLDAQPSAGGDIPPPPPGFTLDAAPMSTAQAQPASQPTEQPSSSTVDELGRQLGLAGRYAIEGVAALPGMVANVPAAAGNLVLGAADSASRAMGGDGVQFRFPDQNQAISDALTRAGLPTPQTPTERVVGDASRGLAGAASTATAANVVAAGRRYLVEGAKNVGQDILGRVARLLGDAPGAQFAAGGTAGSAAGATREAGGGPIAQTAAGIAGAVSPSAAGRTVQAGTKAAIVGGEQGRQVVRQNIDDFVAAGTFPSTGQATQARSMQGVESTLSKLPGGAAPIVNRAESQATQLSAGLDEQATRLAPKATGEQAGRAITRGIEGEGGFVEKFKARQGVLYDELDAFIPATTRIDVSRTLKALANLNASIPGAPNVSRFFQNSKIRSIEGALKKDLKAPTDESMALDAARREAAELEQSRSSAVQDAGRFQAFENSQSVLADQFAPVQGQPRFPGRYSPHPERAAEGAAAARDASAVARQRTAQLQQAQQRVAELEQIAATTDGKLPYEALKKLRTLVGEQVSDWNITNSVPRSKWKALYAALSQDLGTAARGAGDKAQQAWSRANHYTRAGMDRIEAIEGVLNKNGGPEAVFRAATSGTREGATTLRAVMQSLPKEDQRMVSATIVRRLGRAKAGVQDASGEKFSTETFLTNWNSLSPEAKRALFDRHGPEFRKSMDRVAGVAANLREGSQVFKNPSGTSQGAASITALSTFVGAIMSGNFGVAGTVAAGVGAANAMSRLMVNPKFVRWLARSHDRPKSAVPALLQSLAQSSDPEMQEAAALLQAAVTPTEGTLEQ